jgi:hypothetical protein
MQLSVEEDNFPLSASSSPVNRNEAADDELEAVDEELDDEAEELAAFAKPCSLHLGWRCWQTYLQSQNTAEPV